MKTLTIVAAVAIALTGCASSLKNDRTMVIEGEVQDVKVINISSFKVEVAPRKAVCQVKDTAGNPVDTECLQYRQPHQSNYNVLSGNINGFEYEPGYRYVLDLKQEALVNEETKVVTPVWTLNKVLSKTPDTVAAAEAVEAEAQAAREAAQ